MFEGEWLIDQALHLTLMPKLQIPKLINQPIIDILILPKSDQLRDLFLNSLITLLGIAKIKQALLLAMYPVQVENILIILLVASIDLIRLELFLEVVVEVVELGGEGFTGWDEDSLLLFYEVLDADVDYH